MLLNYFSTSIFVFGLILLRRSFLLFERQRISFSGVPRSRLMDHVLQCLSNKCDHLFP